MRGVQLIFGRSGQFVPNLIRLNRGGRETLNAAMLCGKFVEQRKICLTAALC